MAATEVKPVSPSSVRAEFFAFVYPSQMGQTSYDRVLRLMPDDSDISGVPREAIGHCLVEAPDLYARHRDWRILEHIYYNSDDDGEPVVIQTAADRLDMVTVPGHPKPEDCGTEGVRYLQVAGVVIPLAPDDQLIARPRR